MARKHDAEAAGGALRVALSKAVQDMQRHLLEASEQGLEYQASHGSAYAAYVKAEAFMALAQGGEAIARALALATTIPQSGGYFESDIGRGLAGLSDDQRRAAVKTRQAYIHDVLTEMALHYSPRADVPEIGAFDLGALTARELLTPAQQSQERRALAAQA